MGSSKLKVVFLVGGDSASTRHSIEAVCGLPGIEPVGILLDTEAPSFGRRWKNLRRNIRVNGWRYPHSRIVAAMAEAANSAVHRAASSRTEVRKVLRDARSPIVPFPWRSWAKSMA